VSQGGDQGQQQWSADDTLSCCSCSLLTSVSQPVNTCPLGTNLDRKKEIRGEGKNPAVPSRVDLPADYKPPLGFSISRIFSSTSSEGLEKTVISLDGLKEIGSKFWIC